MAQLGIESSKCLYSAQLTGTTGCTPDAAPAHPPPEVLDATDAVSLAVGTDSFSTPKLATLFILFLREESSLFEVVEDAVISALLIL